MKIYTVDEVAAILSISAISVRRHIKNASLKASKVGMLWRVAEHDLQNFLDKNSNQHEGEKKDGTGFG